VPKTNRRAELGRAGEERAAAWYRAHGYAVVERNWRCAAGEVDLICARGRTLVVCEVKARRSTTHGDPLEAVTTSKQRRLRLLAAAYLRSQAQAQAQASRWDEIRFDVAAVLGTDLHVVEGAF
jgi:putative endonuclease